MKRVLLPIVAGMLLTLVCLGILISPWWHGFMSPTRNAQCLPSPYIEYPFAAPTDHNTLQPYTPYILRTEIPLKTIKDFYDSNLIGDSTWGDGKPARWERSEVRSGEHLYECSASLNWEEMERGCIYLRERDGKTVVERIWIYSATAAPMCEAYISELPLR